MTTAAIDGALGASFRDPSGVVFRRDGVLYRQINEIYRPHYDRLMGSGLHESLVDDGLLVPHEEVDVEPVDADRASLVVRPTVIPFISYPYEWCFGQFKAAARLTLEVQRRSLEAGMTLKDASAYNVQFIGARPVLIDTLSFEPYEEGSPWVAYRQFCQHFLAPLALMAYRDVRLGRLLTSFIDGVPLDLAAGLLPARTKWRPGLLSHVHLHARSQRRHADRPVDVKTRRLTPFALRGLLTSLDDSIKRLQWKAGGTEWAEYYDQTNYTDEAMTRKAAIVESMIDEAAPSSAWDLGANTGRFSRIAADRGIPIVAFDIDPAAVELNYRQCRKDREERVLPLVLDLTAPSPAIGWDNRERDGIADRGPTDLVLALALVHHLAISNNVPLERVARFLARVGRWLVIEFVPKTDSQVQRLLASREDIFDDYTAEGFERAFSRHFEIRRTEPVEGSERTMHLMKTRVGP